MDEANWEQWVKKYGYLVRPNQYKFYKQIFDFLVTPYKDILICEGGMGLGKTFATTSGIAQFPAKPFFIATPTGARKNEWSNERKNNL